MPGYKKEYEEAVKALLNVCADKKISQTYYCYTGGLGTDEPLYVWVAYAKNAIDYHEQQKLFWETLGEEGVGLFQKWMKYVRKREARTGRIRVGLSYKIETEEKKKWFCLKQKI